MSEVTKVYGAPGTGKTAFLIGKVQEELANGVRPEQIIYTSFTKAAATEARDRAVSKFLDYSPDQFCFFATIHSICFRLLDLSRNNVFTGKKFLDFCHMYGYETSDSSNNASEHDTELQDRILKTDTDYFEHFIGWYRNMMIDFEVAYNLFTTQVDVPKEFSIERLKVYIMRRNEYKAKTETWDYSDMLEAVLQQQLIPHNIQVIISDEANDLTPLLSSVLKMWASKTTRYYMAGDPYQCLPAGTKILTPDGERNIEQIKSGNNVISSIGGGHTTICTVSDINKSHSDCLFITITTKSGRVLRLTHNHRLFAYFPDIKNINRNHKSQYYYLYLMYKEQIGWRMGITNQPGSRIRTEGNAPIVYLIRDFDTGETARYYEAFYSLCYGIPTQTFIKHSPEQLIYGDKLKTLCDQLNVGERVKRLTNEFGFDINFPTIVPQSSTKADRLVLNINMSTGSWGDFSNPVHRLTLETDNPEIYNKLIRAGYHLKKSKYGMRMMVELKDFGDALTMADEIKQTVGGVLKITHTAIIEGKGRSGLIMPAGNVMRGFMIPVYTDNGVIFDDVVDIRREHGTEETYDINVSRAHNYFANKIMVHNCLYSWAGADPSIMLDMKCDKTVNLAQSHRCPVAVHDLSRKIVNRFRIRYPNDDYKPKNEPGVISYSVAQKIPWQELSGKRVFYLHRTHYLLNMAMNQLIEDVVPFMTLRGKKSPLQTSDATLADIAYRLITGSSVTISNITKMMDYIPTKTKDGKLYLESGAKTKCRDMVKKKSNQSVYINMLPQLGFTKQFLNDFNGRNAVSILHGISDTNKVYLTKLVNKYGIGVLENQPSVIAGTLHSVKGMEADVSIINLNLTRKTYQAMINNPDQEHRLFYVAVTRSKDRVILVQPDDYQSYIL